jgi:hypothetical protein
MTSLDDLTLATFASLLHGRFRADLGTGEPLALELVEAVDLGGHSATASPRPGERSPFSIVFRGPREPVLSQRTYRVEHERLGAFELFLVPVGRDESGMRYEAVFA